MSKMILGRKLGMTQVFDEKGKRIPVTVVQVGPMTVIGKKSAAGKDGYAAVKVGFEDARKQQKDDDVRYRGLTAAQVGVFTKLGIEPKRFVREFHVSEAELSNYEIGQTIDHSLFKVGEWIDVTGTSKGTGFTGVMKRHNFSGFKSSHGAHETFRGPGAISANTFPGRVFAGKKMAGRSGNARTTVQNLRIVRILVEENLYLIRGAIPGANGSLVAVRNAVKKRA